MVNPIIAKITTEITNRSAESRNNYENTISNQKFNQPYRSRLSCGNLAHAYAACDQAGKEKLSTNNSPNIGIVTAYNDMLSAHHPYANYPEIIKSAARKYGATAQVAGGVPAMCDGVTQGQSGMELSLFSRDNIAMSTAIALSHDMFDGAAFLGICDKIVPGLLIGALSFGHLPGIFIPAGPMGSGIPNKEKARIRQEFAKGNISKTELLKAESQSYHSAGTCTFYGTANSNQMLMEIMGLQLPGSSFEHPISKLRTPLTQHAINKLLNLIGSDKKCAIGEIVSCKTIVNAVVGLLATGGSTNHTIHLIAIAKAAGIKLTWQDFAEISAVVPLVCRVYPNGEADINHFHAEGGMSFLISELLNNGFLHNDVSTILGKEGLIEYALQPSLKQNQTIALSADTSGRSPAKKPENTINYVTRIKAEPNNSILRSPLKPFSKDGGLRLLNGNIGKAIIKTSAVASEHQSVTAPAVVFQSQNEFAKAFERGELNKDFVAVLIFQGPQSNGMPELHKLTPLLGSLQDQGRKVALVTDGRMSGASGKVPCAIHLVPEAINGGFIGRLKDNDIITIDCTKNELRVHLTKDELDKRHNIKKNDEFDGIGVGRELFSIFRNNVNPADEGASIFGKNHEK